MKNLIEIWAIDEKWNTLKEFKNHTDVESWISTKPTYFQILYRKNGGAVHVY
jgi:hypothetical protein